MNYSPLILLLIPLFGALQIFLINKRTLVHKNQNAFHTAKFTFLSSFFFYLYLLYTIVLKEQKTTVLKLHHYWFSNIDFVLLVDDISVFSMFSLVLGVFAHLMLFKQDNDTGIFKNRLLAITLSIVITPALMFSGNLLQIFILYEALAIILLIFLGKQFYISNKRLLFEIFILMSVTVYIYSVIGTLDIHLLEYQLINDVDRNIIWSALFLLFAYRSGILPISKNKQFALDFSNDIPKIIVFSMVFEYSGLLMIYKILVLAISPNIWVQYCSIATITLGVFIKISEIKKTRSLFIFSLSIAQMFLAIAVLGLFLPNKISIIGGIVGMSIFPCQAAIIYLCLYKHNLTNKTNSIRLQNLLPIIGASFVPLTAGFLPIFLICYGCLYNKFFYFSFLIIYACYVQTHSTIRLFYTIQDTSVMPAKENKNSHAIIGMIILIIYIITIGTNTEWISNQLREKAETILLIRE